MDKNKKVNAVGTSGYINEMLDDLVAKRKSEGHLVRSKVSIVAELVTKAHRKECK